MTFKIIIFKVVLLNVVTFKIVTFKIVTFKIAMFKESDVQYCDNRAVVATPVNRPGGEILRLKSDSALTENLTLPSAPASLSVGSSIDHSVLRSLNQKYFLGPEELKKSLIARF